MCNFYNKCSLLILIMTIYCCLAVAQSQTAYAIYFKNKNNSNFSLQQPEQFLSLRAIDRRNKQLIDIDSTDLPVSQIYIDSILNNTTSVLHLKSKWLNCMVILATDSQNLAAIAQWSFVQHIQKVGYFNFPLHQISPVQNRQSSPTLPTHSATAFGKEHYGEAWEQIALSTGQVFHHNGLEGQDIYIAVIDAGFKGVDTIAAFQHLFNNNKIIDQYNFNRNNQQVFIDGQHGTQVLSTMAGFAPGELVGTAPKASYALYYTEHNNTEQPIELYNLTAALERADSVGCQLANISLGYNEFDNVQDNLSYADLNGTTTVAAQAVNHAFQKGLGCIVSAGNEGNSSWKHILTPADAPGALTVGSVDPQLFPSHFTGLGFTNTSKPDIAAMGSEAAIIKNDGTIVRSFGTSFATPIITGMIACYLQAYPNYKIEDVFAYVKSIGHLGTGGFNNTIGTGVPNFKNAMSTDIIHNTTVQIYPNPASHQLNILIPHTIRSTMRYSLFNMSGLLLRNQEHTLTEPIDITNLPAGIYTIYCSWDQNIAKQIFIKQ